MKQGGQMLFLLGLLIELYGGSDVTTQVPKRRVKANHGRQQSEQRTRSLAFGAERYWRIRRRVPRLARTSSSVLILTKEVSLPPPVKTSSRSITFGSIRNSA